MRHRAGQTLVYFSVSNSLAIKKINSTQDDGSLYSEAKGLSRSGKHQGCMAGIARVLG